MAIKSKKQVRIEQIRLTNGIVSEKLTTTMNYGKTRKRACGLY